MPVYPTQSTPLPPTISEMLAPISPYQMLTALACIALTCVCCYNTRGKLAKKIRIVEDNPSAHASIPSLVESAIGTTNNNLKTAADKNDDSAERSQTTPTNGKSSQVIPLLTEVADAIPTGGPLGPLRG